MSRSPKFAYADGSSLRVCIIGAGVAGICMAAQLKRALNLDSYVIYETESGVGGAWLVNNYPGCQVDVPAWAYSYSFAQSPDWSQLCPDRDEMLAYLKRVAAKYDIHAHAQFNTNVRSAVWKDETATWEVTVTTDRGRGAKEHVQEFDIVILGTGLLRDPSCPSMFDGFTGPKMHSARWDHSVALEGKVVGLVGSGSSAIQIIPSIAPSVRQLCVYMREPAYAIPKAQASIGCILKWIFKLLPFVQWIIRAAALLISESLVPIYNSGSLAGKLLVRFNASRLRAVIKDETLRSQLTPVYPAGYKIPTFATASYLETFNRSNVKLVRSPIVSCEGSTLTTQDGQHEQIDVLILCTGFKVMDFFGPLQIVGLNGVDLLNKWKEGRPEAFYGITCSETPNMFLLIGPNSSSPTNGVIFSLECQVSFVINALRALRRRDAASIRVRGSAQAKCMAEIDGGAKKKVYMQPSLDGVGVGTFLVNGRGYPMFWPKSSTALWLRTRRLDPNNFEFISRMSRNKKELGGRRKAPKSVAVVNIV